MIDKEEHDWNLTFSNRINYKILAVNKRCIRNKKIIKIGKKASITSIIEISATPKSQHQQNHQTIKADEKYSMQKQQKIIEELMAWEGRLEEIVSAIKVNLLLCKLLTLFIQDTYSRRTCMIVTSLQ